MFKRRQIRAIKRAFRKLFKRTWNWATTVSKSVIDWFLRSVLLIGVSKGQQNHAKAGFVLPTVIMLLLVVTLVVATLLVRTQNRTSQVIGAREEQVIYNAATPAIERAKAKLEYLFTQDTRMPTGAVSDGLLLKMLVNDNRVNDLSTVTNPNPYTFERETILDINQDGIPDPAWAYESDVDNDGRNETVVYGIYLRSRSRDQNISISGVIDTDSNGNPILDRNGRADTDQEKALALVTRNGPINTINLNDRVCADLTRSSTTPPPPDQERPVDESVWYPSGSGVLRKTFQVDAIVVSRKEGTSRTVATLEFQQDRQLDKANRWGAWFRYDMELYPGVPFNWNGAMYSGGSIFVGSGDLFRAFLISSEKSCFYGKDSSEVVVLEEPAEGGTRGFQGQIVANRLFDGNAGQARFDLQREGGNNTQPDLDLNRTTFNGSKDSTDKNAADLSLNPDILFTQDLSRARAGNDRNLDARVAAWENGAFVRQGRMRNNLQNPPYVDDTYRADDRYGPKPKYDRVDRRYWLRSPDTPGNPQNGDPIPTSETKLISNTTDTVSDPEFRNLGLDGYWERRAWANGVRIIVSPRLELGNSFGWVNRDLNANGNRNDPGEIDPLYPMNRDAANSGNISHEQQQRRTLRDNLAAVQSTVVYHASSGSGSPAGNTPVACVTTTTHPGSLQKDQESRNFQLSGQRYWYPGQPTPLVSDFFYGYGTNGWEYTVPTLANFESGPLRTALQNLANFAGDYNNVNDSGAYPPTQGGRVYPNPYITMWGNFSNLKRALTLPSSRSIADNSYLHTAGCTLGMLANNINYFQQAPNYDASWWTASPANFTTLATTLRDTVQTPPPPLPSPAFPSTGFTPAPDDFIGLLEKANVNQDLLRLARFVHMKEQIVRDRQYGFADSPLPPGTTSDNRFRLQVRYIGQPAPGSPPGSTSPMFQYGAMKYTANPTASDEKNTFEVGCDLGANSYFGLGDPAGWTDAWSVRQEKEQRLIVLATSLCNTRPKFPSLYYLFPGTPTHNRTQVPPIAPAPANWPSISTSEPYLNRPSPYNSGPGEEQFTQISDPELTAIANMVQPKGENWTGGNNNPNGNWYLPTNDQANPAPPLENDFQITSRNGGTRFTSLIDSAFFDGREMMTVRALTLDLNLLRSRQIGSDTWLPKSGIIYAFREDAVREDAIIRPAGGTTTNNTDPGSPRDPQYPTASNNRISTKPVDFYPDPDRRSYGFRIRNGQDLRRAPGGAVDNENPRGMTLISDNPVYIQGDLNYHSTDGTTNNLEEFRTQLQQPSWGNFYNREDLEDRFARIGSGKDTWRPTEILSDAVTILSNNFRKGYIDLGISNDTSSAATPGGRYSFRAINGPNSAPPNGWILEDGTLRTATNNQKPIKVSRNGNPMSCNSAASTASGICPPTDWREYTTGYRPFITDYRGAVNQATDTRVNSIIVSGIIPSRNGQGNGGFHNFPRFIENWNTINSFISGSFLQLNFSTYATGPFNQSAWEPGASPNGGAPAWYYQPPNRIWGYDVGLQYAPAGPLAQRFVTSGKKRSEFYRDLEVDDPYICRLRLALNSFNGQDPASRRECN
jgi:hypothetical protein